MLNSVSLGLQRGVEILQKCFMISGQIKSISYNASLKISGYLFEDLNMFKTHEILQGCQSDAKFDILVILDSSVTPPVF